jgi:hypothetical protein
MLAWVYHGTRHGPRPLTNGEAGALTKHHGHLLQRTWHGISLELLGKFHGARVVGSRTALPRSQSRQRQAEACETKRQAFGKQVVSLAARVPNPERLSEAKRGAFGSHGLACAVVDMA